MQVELADGTISDRLGTDLNLMPHSEIKFHPATHLIRVRTSKGTMFSGVELLNEDKESLCKVTYGDDGDETKWEEYELKKGEAVIGIYGRVIKEYCYHSIGFVCAKIKEARTVNEFQTEKLPDPLWK